MKIDGKVHCFFEQSGTFRDEFRKLGIPAEDYDIQNNYGRTDHVIDLFAEIELAYSGGGKTIFDSINCGDLIIAFFPCIRFCSVMEQMQHEDFYDSSQGHIAKNYGTEEYYITKWNNLRKQSQERFFLYDIALKLTAICQIKKLRMIMENPYHPTNFTNHFWFMRVSLIDKDRTLRGDFYRKPTGYWFVNCEPTYGCSFQKKHDIKRITAGSGAAKSKRKLKQKISKETLNDIYIDHSGKNGICDEKRSLISSDYARNFICDFILGVEQPHSLRSLF